MILSYLLRLMGMIKVYGKLSRGLSSGTTEPEIEKKEKESERRAKNGKKCRWYYKTGRRSKVVEAV